MFTLFGLTSPHLTLAVAALLITLSAPTPSQAGSKLSKSLDDCLHCRKTEKHHPKRDEDDEVDLENPSTESSSLLPRSGELRHRGHAERTNEAKRPIGPADSKEQNENESDSTDLSKLIITDGAIDLTETASASESKTLAPLREVVQALEGENDLTSLGDLLDETASAVDAEALKIVHSAYQRVGQRTQNAEVLLEPQDPFRHRDKKALTTDYHFGYNFPPLPRSRSLIEHKTSSDEDSELMFEKWRIWTGTKSDRIRALFSAVSHPGNTETVKFLMPGLDVGQLKFNFVDFADLENIIYRNSLLEEAAKNGDEETVAALVDAGAEVTFKAIANAIRSNTLSVVEGLIIRARGNPLPVKDWDKNTDWPENLLVAAMIRDFNTNTYLREGTVGTCDYTKLVLKNFLKTYRSKHDQTLLHRLAERIHRASGPGAYPLYELFLSNLEYFNGHPDSNRETPKDVLLRMVGPEHPAMPHLKKLKHDPRYPSSRLEHAQEAARDFFFRRERGTSTNASAPFASPLPYSNFKEFVREITTKGLLESKNLGSFLNYAIALGGKPLAEQLLSEKGLSEYFDKIAFFLWDQHPTAFLDRRFLSLSPELNYLESYSNLERLQDPYREPLQTIVSKTIQNTYRQSCKDEVLPVLSGAAVLEAIVWGYLTGQGPAWTPARETPTWYQPRREQNTNTTSLARPSIAPTQGSADSAEQKQTASTQKLVTNPASSLFGQVVEDNANDNMDETDSMNVDADVPAPRPESTSSLSYRPSPPSSINSSLSTSTSSASPAPKAMSLDSANVNSATPAAETPAPGNGNAKAHDMVIDIGVDYRDPMIFYNSNLNFYPN